MESRMRKSLGKGLEALLTAPTPAATPSELEVPIHEIVPNPEQPRRHFDDEALGLLADSIRRHGLLQPLVARHIAGRYELIAGERRLRAALRAGLGRGPAIVREARAEGRLRPAPPHGRRSPGSSRARGRAPDERPGAREEPEAGPRRENCTGARSRDRLSPAGPPVACRAA